LDKTVVMHATSIGFNIETWARFRIRAHNTIMFSCKTPLDDAIKKLADYLGTRYNYSGLFGAILQLIASWFGRYIKNPWNNPRKLFCSEAIVLLLQYAKVPGSEQFVPASTSPEMLLEYMIASPDFEKVDDAVQ
jgi:hypothetical protein